MKEFPHIRLSCAIFKVYLPYLCNVFKHKWHLNNTTMGIISRLSTTNTFERG